MEFSCVFGVRFSIDFVSENRSDFHGFSQTAWKNVLVSKPCQSVESSMTSRQNGLRSFQEMQKIRKKRQKSLQKSIPKINRKKNEKHAKIMQKSCWVFGMEACSVFVFFNKHDPAASLLGLQHRKRVLCSFFQQTRPEAKNP